MMYLIFRVKDNGMLEGIGEGEMAESIGVIGDLSRRAGLSIAAIETLQIGPFKFISQIRIESNALQAARCTPDYKLAFLGDSGCGKTTLLSVLSDEAGRLDDGHGSMRARLLHHRHELLSGSTSSTSWQSLAFSAGSPLQIPSDTRLLQPSLRLQLLHSAQIIHVIDSAGKLRFDHTMLSTLTTLRKPDGVCLLIEAPPPTLDASFATSTLSQQSRELLRLISGLDLHLAAIIITKIDVSSTESLGVLLEELAEAVGRSVKLQVFGQEEAPLANCVPVLFCSAVSGDYLDAVQSFFGTHSLAVQEKDSMELLAEEEDLAGVLVIESVSQVTGCGTVVWGQVSLGSFNCGDDLLLRPISGDTERVFQIASMERLRLPVKEARSGQYISIALRGGDSENLKRGQLLVKRKNNPVSLSFLPFKPIRRIIAELSHFTAPDSISSLVGLLYIAGQKHPARLDLEPQSLRRRSMRAGRVLCLLTLRESFPAAVFLQPGAAVVFVETGRRARFCGQVIDYFCRS